MFSRVYILKIIMSTSSKNFFEAFQLVSNIFLGANSETSHE